MRKRTLEELNKSIKEAELFLKILTISWVPIFALCTAIVLVDMLSLGIEPPEIIYNNPVPFGFNLIIFVFIIAFLSSLNQLEIKRLKLLVES